MGDDNPTLLERLGLGDMIKKAEEAAAAVEQQAERVAPIIKTATGWTIVGLAFEGALGAACLGVAIYLLTEMDLSVVGGVIAILAAALFAAVDVYVIVLVARLRNVAKGLLMGAIAAVSTGLGLVAMIPRMLKWTRALFVVQIISGAGFVVAGILAAVDDNGGAAGLLIAVGVILLGVGVAALFVMRWGLRKIVNHPDLPEGVRVIFLRESVRIEYKTPGS